MFSGIDPFLHVAFALSTLEVGNMHVLTTNHEESGAGLQNLDYAIMQDKGS